MSKDVVYYIEMNGTLYETKPFPSYDEAYIHVMESGMYYEGEWEIVEWEVD